MPTTFMPTTFTPTNRPTNRPTAEDLLLKYWFLYGGQLEYTDCGSCLDAEDTNGICGCEDEDCADIMGQACYDLCIVDGSVQAVYDYCGGDEYTDCGSCLDAEDTNDICGCEDEDCADIMVDACYDLCIVDGSVQAVYDYCGGDGKVQVCEITGCDKCATVAFDQGFDTLGQVCGNCDCGQKWGRQCGCVNCPSTQVPKNHCDEQNEGRRRAFEKQKLSTQNLHHTFRKV